jgi:serine/threonine protein kinase
MFFFQILEVDGVPKIIDNSFNTIDTNFHSSPKFWILIDSIETTTLYELIDQRSLCIQEILIITLKLLNLIRQIHNRNVVHRNISPRNILINYDSSMSPDQIHVSLIDFDFAWIEQPNNDSSNFDSVKDIIPNDFYQVPQFDIQPSNKNGHDENIEQIEFHQRSRTIDTSFITAILFWMITGHEPKCSRDVKGQVPHQRDGIQEMINKTLISEAGKN